MKKQLLLLLIIMLSLTASADETGTCGDGVIYKFEESNKTLTISKSDSGAGTMTDYSRVNRAPWYSYRENIHFLIIGDGVTSIGDNSFEGTNIISAYIPNSIKTIGAAAFYWCVELSSVYISNSVTSIGKWCFQHCHNLKTIDLPNSVKDIYNGAFYESGLISISIPNQITTIRSETFRNCANLTSIVIPPSVESIETLALGGCENFEIHISNLENWCNVNIENALNGSLYLDGVKIINLEIPEGVTSVNQYTFCHQNIQTLSLPNSVNNIDACAFFDCQQLSSVTIGTGIKSIGNRAFYNCVNLENFACYADNVPNTAENVFENTDIENRNTTLHVPYNSVDKYKLNPVWQSFKNIVATPRFFYLTYKINGEIYKSYEVEEGKDITPEPEPQKDGYTFSGWSWIPSKMPAEDVTINGTFIAKKYKLTYIVDDEVYKIYEVAYESPITPEDQPTKEGYTFSGWSYIPSKMPNEDVTVTGTFSINSYTLTYMIDGEVYKKVEYEYGSTITPEPQPEGDYITFEWAELPETMPAHDVTVYASYTSGIEEIIMNQKALRIYRTDGKPRKELQKGINIIKMTDGTTMKIVVK